MRALVLGDNGVLTLEHVPDPSTRDECLIRVTHAGICGTDLQMLDGYAGFTGVPGHEFVGVVEESPAADAHWLGRRVVGELNVGCGVCEWCQSGVKEHCPTRTVVGIRGRGGAFAEYLSLPAANLHEVPDTMDDATAVFVEPVAAACRIAQQVEITADTRVAVVGDGRLGNLTAQVLRTRTTDVVLFGKHTHKLMIAREVGIDAWATDQDSDPSIGSRFSDNQRGSFDVVVDATGRPAGLRHAIELVKPRGVVVLKSTFHGEAPATLWPVPVHEITVVGSRCGPFKPAIALLASGDVRTAPLLSHTFPLEAREQAFATARVAMKVLFDVHLGSTRARRT